MAKGKRKPNKGLTRTKKEWEESFAGHIGKLIDRTSLDDVLRLILFAGGTVTLHNLNIGGVITWFGKSNDYVGTGLPYPFHRRIKFPWEQGDTPTIEDKVTEWFIPAISSYVLIYKPEAIAAFIDAMIPF